MSHFKFAALLVFVVVVVLCSQNAQAAIARVNYGNPSHPGKCVITSHFIMSPGQTDKAPNHPCAGITCLDNGHAEYRTCQAVAPPKGCKLRDFVNTNRSYPECCERHYDCSKQI